MLFALLCIHALVQSADVTPYGSELGWSRGIRGYSNGDSDFVSDEPHREGDVYYGMKWQCVEYARRWLIRTKFLTFESVGCANDIWHISNLTYVGTNNSVPLNRVPNGSKCFPKVGNILIYNRATEAPYGHVAIIVKVTSSYVRVAEQNWSNMKWPGDYSRVINRNKAKGGYNLETPGFSILGWLVYEGNYYKTCFDAACATCSQPDTDKNSACYYL